jgi:hypothetical protein
MAWNDELRRAFGTRCSECGQAFEEGDTRKELGFGQSMHEACYAKVLDDIERGVLGYSGENTESCESERKRFLEHAEDEKRRALAIERNRALWGRETAKRLDRVATWMIKNNRKRRTKS